MPRIAIINDANTNIIGDAKSVPTSAIPAIRRKYGGSTNAETATNLINHIAKLIRDEIRENEVQLARDVHIAAQASEEPTVRATYDSTTWPPNGA